MARFGVRLDNNGKFTPRDYATLASLAESKGYEVVWVPEGGGFDAVSQLTSIAGNTQSISLATGILPVFSRTPMAIAMAAAGLSSVSNGRFILGLGVGHQPSVEDRDGVAFKKPMARLRETIQIAKGLLAGESVTHQGRMFNLSKASLGAATPAGKVPVFIAALRPKMLELAGELADGVLLNWTASDYLHQAIQQIGKGAAKVGRDPAEIVIGGYVRVAVVDDDESSLDSARQILQREIAGYASNYFYRSFFEQTGFSKEMAAAQNAMDKGDAEAAASAITQEMQDQVAVVGSPEHCQREVEKRRSLGLQIPVIAPFPVGDVMTSYKRTIEAFGG